jgi:hypothetical protein
MVPEVPAVLKIRIVTAVLYGAMTAMIATGSTIAINRSIVNGYGFDDWCSIPVKGS